MYVLFAGAVKVELRKLVSSVPDDQKTPGFRRVMVVHADRVTVVHDIFERSAPPFEAKWGKCSFFRSFSNLHLFYRGSDLFGAWRITLIGMARFTSP